MIVQPWTCPACNSAEQQHTYDEKCLYQKKAKVRRVISVGECRPSVQRMARMMEDQLRRNDDKGGWGHCTTDYLQDRLEQNLLDLKRLQVSDPQNLTWTLDARQRTCADIANFAMMLAENERIASIANKIPHNPYMGDTR